MTLAFLAGFALPALADDIGTVTYQNRTVTGEPIGPFVFPNVTPQAGGEPVCLEYTATCGQFTFTVGDLNGADDPLDLENDFVVVSISWPATDADFDPYLYDADTGELLVNGAGSANPEVMYIPARNGSYSGRYRVDVAPFLPIGESFTPKVEFQKAEVVAKEVLVGATPFDVFNPVKPYTGYSADEPTMGINYQTNNVFMLYNSNTLRTKFDDATSPATATWDDVTNNGRPRIQADPYQASDPWPLPDGSYSPRIWTVGFALATSDMFFSDDEGTTWTETVLSGLPAGVDNESIASGPYPDTQLGNLLEQRSQLLGGKGHAFYYCAHGGVNAFCTRSDDGGLTYEPGRAIFPGASLDCSNHGHVKVGGDGTVYVPMNMPCTGAQGVTVSLDAGETWTYIQVPGPEAKGSGRWDSSIAIARDNKTLYYGYLAAVTDDPMMIKGTLEKVAGAGGTLVPKITWNEPVNLGKTLRIKNAVFPTVVAGDPDRAAVAFHGSLSEGDSGSEGFKGTWYMYVAMTYDGGATWEVNDIQPSDPTQRGGICDRGINCPASPPYRNLLDFMDAMIDRDGRVVVGYADGCIRNCVPEGGKATYSSMGALARQAGGRPLLAANDAMFGKAGTATTPKAPVVTAQALHNKVTLSWKAPYDGGAAIEGYRVYRSVANASPTLLGTLGAAVNAKPYFIDSSVQPGVAYSYQVQAFNAAGNGALSPLVTASVDKAANLASGTTGDEDRPTVQNQPKAEAAESECVPPGLTVVEDGTADGLNGVPLDSSEDIEWIAVSEPGAMTNRIVFTLKVIGLPEPDLPQHRWNVYFTVGDTEWYVAMSNAEGTLAYEYGKTTYTETPAATVGQLERLGTLEPESGHTEDGQIVLVLDTSKIDGLAAGVAVDLIYAKVRATSPDSGSQGAGATLDDTGTGYYETVGNEACRSKALTTAGFTASQKTGTAPITIDFDASPTVFDAGVSARKYVWNFGDGETVETTSPQVSHTFTKDEAYRVSLTVIDTLDRESNHAKLTLLLGHDAGADGLLNEGSYSIFGGTMSLLSLLPLVLAGFRRRRGKTMLGG